MLWTVKKAARYLGLKPHQVYYLLVMGEIEAVRVGILWRLVPESVEDYDKRRIERKIRKPSGNFVYSGNGGFLFYTPPERFPFNPHGKTAGVERRRRQQVHRAQRSQTVLFPEPNQVTQLELFTA